MSSEDFEKYYIKRGGGGEIDPEEAISDAERIKYINSEEDWFLEKKLEVSISPWVFRMTWLVVILVFLIFIARSAQLQLVQGNSYKAMADNNRVRQQILPSPRGIIYDKFGSPLVKNASSFDVIINPLEIPKDKIQKKIFINRLSQVLNFPVEDLEQEIERLPKVKYPQQVLLLQNIGRELVLKLETELNNLSGVSIKKDAIREYTNGYYFSHLLGYMGKIASDDKEKYNGYSLVEKVGKSGLELEYEKILRGEPGYKEIEVDVLNNEKRVLSVKDPIAGSGLFLSIDKDLQEYLYDQLKGFKRASAIVVNPNNGKILALVNQPSFDNNIFSRPISNEEYKKLLNNPDNLFLNRAISGEYPPASTIKPFIALAGLQEKVINPSTTIIDSQGEIYVGNFRFGDWKVHGLTDVIKAIAESCDVFFYYVGGGYGSFKGLGVNKINQYLRMFGFGEATNIDLAAERSGLLPDDKWKRETKKEQWYIGDTYHISIGQGDMLASPIQLAMATAAIANGGVLYKPQLTDAIVDQDKNIIKNIQPEVVRNLIKDNNIDIKNMNIVREGMRQTIVSASGSARFLSDLLVTLAGKTGTAQFGNKDKTHAWFIGFAPYDNPQIAFVVLVEGGGEGSSTAVPIAKNVLQWYFNRDKVGL